MSRRRILITGGTGLLGKALLETAPEELEVFATWHRTPPPAEWRSRFHPLELLEPRSVAGLYDAVRPDAVIHAASIGSVDQAERDPAGVQRVNVDGTQALGRACAERAARFVFISSNAVFDGRHPPYAEDAPVRAVNRYGALKIHAEAWVRDHCQAPLIIRPILMYGWPFPGGRDNAVTRWLDHLERGRAVEVAEDVYSQPLLAANCAEAIWAALRQDRSGTYHVGGADRVSLLELARAAARAFGCPEQLIRPVPSHHFRALAPRPADTSFITTKMAQELGVRPMGVREGLAVMQRTRLLVA